MSKLYTNPFIWGKPVSGNTYISRTTLEQDIQSCLEKERKFILTGYRGTGKTSLVQKLLSKDQGDSIYLDLSFVVDGSSLIHLLSKMIRKSIPAFKDDSRLKLSAEGVIEISVGDLIQILNDHGKTEKKRVIIVWDEFQHVVKLKENTLREIKGGLKGCRHILSIFVSHREDLMIEAFKKKGDKVLPRSSHMNLENIDVSDFRSYLTRLFRRMGLTDFDLPDSVLKFTNGQAHLTQRLASVVASCWLEGNTTRLLDRSLKKLLNEEDANFSISWDQFGVNEKRLFLGLANGFSRPTELSFINRFGLSATSTAHNTVLKLLREGWLINRDEGYYIYDPLFLQWLMLRNDIS